MAVPSYQVKTDQDAAARPPAAAPPGADPAARSRVNSVYIATFFLGGAVGSQAGALAYHLGGWGAVCVTGAVLPALSLAWRATERRPA
jgi:predicted MFS family arabinose efflux permease